MSSGQAHSAHGTDDAGISALPGDPGWLPPASPRRYDEATVVFHLRPNQQPLVAHWFLTGTLTWPQRWPARSPGGTGVTESRGRGDAVDTSQY